LTTTVAAAFLRHADPAAVRDTARLLLALASLSRVVGRDDWAELSIADAVDLLEHAATLRQDRRR
jgi:hypothetical protein